MFKKEFKAKNQTQVKSSDRKKLRQQIQDSFPNVSDEILSLIIPTGKNDDFVSCKLLLNSGEDVTVYLSNKTPWFFTLFDRTTKKESILPTVYFLWKCPALIELKFRTHRQVFDKLFNGADLMLPGVIVPSGIVDLKTFAGVQRDQLCVICLENNRYPIAVGHTAMDGEDMYMSGMKGRAVTILHIYQDLLWNFGPKSEAPFEEESQEPASKEVEPSVETKEASSSQEIEYPQSADEILDAIFLYLCQRKAKNYQVPLLVSTFFNFMQDCVPGLTLDLKQSSYKKFSKFLQHQEEVRQLIKLEETKPGVLSIVEFNLMNNDHLESFRIPFWLKFNLQKISMENELNKTETTATSKYKFPTVTELWKKSSRIDPLFEETSSKMFYRADEIRQTVRNYVIRNGLNDGKLVRPDELLKKICQSSEPTDWNSLNEFVFKAMTPFVEFEFSHLEQSIRVSGALMPIEIECFERNRKRQTLVKNLDIYQIDLQDLCKRIRQGASVSATIDEDQETKRHGRILLAQGNQIAFIARLLKDIYGVPNKFIREID